MSETLMSPDGRDTLQVHTPEAVQSLVALGWTRSAKQAPTRVSSSETQPSQPDAGSQQPTKRGPGRPRKYPRGEDSEE